MATFSLCLLLFVLVNTLTNVRYNHIAVASGFEFEVTDEFVDFYENEISHHKVISNLEDEDFTTLENKYNLTRNKVSLLLILEDFGKLVDNPKTFDELTKTSDNKLILYAKTLVNVYSQNLDEDEKELLKLKFLTLLKGKSSKTNHLITTEQHPIHGVKCSLQAPSVTSNQVLFNCRKQYLWVTEILTHSTQQTDVKRASFFVHICIFMQDFSS